MPDRLVVAKFGGAALKDSKSIDRAAAIISGIVTAGTKVIVVVSAQMGMTDQLLAKGLDQARDAKPELLDVLLAAGEQMASALFAIALNKTGVKGIPLQGHQIPILTDSVFQDANIKSLSTSRLHSILNEGGVPVVSGFQGVTGNGDITTLGRNGSDTSAVAIAARMNADCCMLFKDVGGVYNIDPNGEKALQALDLQPEKFVHLNYEAMLALVEAGSQVLHQRSILWALRYQVPLYLRSVFSDQPGTWISSDRYFQQSPSLTLEQKHDYENTQFG